jgi:hypothetical protein
MGQMPTKVSLVEYGKTWFVGITSYEVPQKSGQRCLDKYCC